MVIHQVCSLVTEIKSESDNKTQCHKLVSVSAELDDTFNRFPEKGNNHRNQLFLHASHALLHTTQLNHDDILSQFRLVLLKLLVRYFRCPETSDELKEEVCDDFLGTIWCDIIDGIMCW